MECQGKTCCLHVVLVLQKHSISMVTALKIRSLGKALRLAAGRVCFSLEADRHPTLSGDDTHSVMNCWHSDRVEHNYCMTSIMAVQVSVLEHLSLSLSLESFHSFFPLSCSASLCLSFSVCQSLSLIVST